MGTPAGVQLLALFQFPLPPVHVLVAENAVSTKSLKLTNSTILHILPINLITLFVINTSTTVERFFKGWGLQKQHYESKRI